MEVKLTERVRFGEFEFDLKAGELRQGDRKVVLREQPFQILRMLIECRGQVVTRDEIKKKLWPNDTIVEFDHSIQSAISRLRQALGDAADHPSYIETVARRGYRLMVEVRSLSRSSSDSSPALESPPSDPGSAFAVAGPAADLIGKKVSHYRVLEVVGGGGMGVVYKAEDLKLGRRVAMKFLPEELGDDAKARERFEREARAASTLDHPNICAIHEFGDHDGRPFIVMPLLEGQNLRDLIAARGGPFSLAEILNFGMQIASGLEAAHERGIIHRDIKPANIFVTERGEAKILDFGLAKLTAATGEAEIGVAAGSIDARSLGLTRTGAALGTAPYMSPEQVRGEPLDVRTDTFGLVLYEMATGQCTFSGETAAVVQDAILSRTATPARQFRPDLSPKLEEIIAKALEKDRERRYQVASELQADLKSLAGSDQERFSAQIGESQGSAGFPRTAKWTDRSASTSRRSRGAKEREPEWHRRPKWAMAGLLLVTAMGIGWYLHRLTTKPNASAPATEIRALTESGKSRQAASTPDGRYVAYVNRDTGNDEMRLLQIATERDVQILPSSPLDIFGLHFSPDGNFIYFLQGLRNDDSFALGAFRIATLGGPATLLDPDVRATEFGTGSITVSPDGKQIAYISRTQTESLILAIDPDGSNRHILAKRPIEQAFRYIEWSPSPDTLAAVVMGADNRGLVSVDLRSGTVHDVSVTGWKSLGQPAWSPDGSTIFSPAIRGGGGEAHIWAVDARTGSQRPVTSGIDGFITLSLCSNARGDLIGVTRRTETALWITDSFGRNPRPLLSNKGERPEDVAWIDGRVVSSNWTEMWLHDPDGRAATKLRSSSDYYSAVIRCGPGKVAYVAYDDKHRSYVARTDITTGATSALTEGPADSTPTCTQDGSTLVFARCTQHGDHCSLTRKSLDSGQSDALYEIGSSDKLSWEVHLSPDGSKIFFHKVHPKDPYEWGMVLPIAGGAAKVIRMPVSEGEMASVRWAPDGKSLFYDGLENDVANIWSIPIDGQAPPKRITNFQSEDIYDFDVSPDNRLVMSRGQRIRDVVLIKNVR